MDPFGGGSPPFSASQRVLGADGLAAVRLDAPNGALGHWRPLAGTVVTRNAVSRLSVRGSGGRSLSAALNGMQAAGPATFPELET